MCVYTAPARGRMMERCGNERGPDQRQCVPDVTGHNWMSHFIISHRQAMTGEGTREEKRGYGRGVGWGGGRQGGWKGKDWNGKN